MIAISREDIDREGFTTTTQVLHSLPQNFGFGANEGVAAVGGPSSGNGSNFGGGAGVNLRGLGTGSTLVLLNGRRLPASGYKNDFVDVSMIPLVAVERIEVLTDGASAVYGSDAVGGVVNIILKDSYEGAETRALFGSAGGDAEELQFSQLFGTSWDRGHALAAYEYYDRGNLPAQSRSFAADSDLTRYGGNNFSSANSNPGNIVGLDQNYGIPAGQDGTALTPSDLLPGVTNFQNTLEGTDLLPHQRRHSVFLSAAQRLNDSISLSADAQYSDRDVTQRSPAQMLTLEVPSTNPFYVNPAGTTEPVRVAYSFIDDLGPRRWSGNTRSYGTTLGLTWEAPQGSWRLQTYANYGEVRERGNSTNVTNSTALTNALNDTDPATALNVFGDGSHTNSATIEAIRGWDKPNATSRISSFYTKADGGVFSLPGGAAKLALGAEYRDESFDYYQLSFRSGTEPVINRAGSPPNSGTRNVAAGFAELYLPFIGESNAWPGMRRFTVSLAGRVEDYSDFGSTADPRLGVLWSPISSLSIRGTIGTSFKAPLLSEMGAETRIIGLGLVNPHSPTGMSNTLLIIGRSELAPEEATTWSAGLKWQPSNRFNLELNYFDIEIEDRIRAAVTDPFAVFADEAAYAPVVIHNPTPEQIDAWFNHPGFDFATFPASETEWIMDARVGNLAVVSVRGLDLLLSHSLPTRAGVFDVSLNGSYLLSMEERITKTAPSIDVVGTLGNPTQLRLRPSVTWSRDQFGMTAAVNYVDGYRDQVSAPERHVSSWTTCDMQFSYSIGDGITAGLRIQNVFDRDPPFANISVGVGYDAVNADPLGRVVIAQLRKQW